MDFGNHSLCVFVNAENQHCREDSRDNGTDQDTEENGGIHDIKAGDELLAGLGKSYLGNAIAYRALCRGIDAARTTAYGFVQDMLSDIRGEGRHAQRYRSAPLLVLDDLGTEPLIPNVTEESLFAVVNERAARGLATVLATNLAPAGLQERYGERVFSRLSDGGNTRILKLEGENLRWRKPPC